MARTVQLGTLVSRAKKGADQENQETISPTGWKEWISLVYAELYGEISKPGVGYFDEAETITTTGASQYDLPADHLATIGVDEILDANGRRRPLAELMIQERGLFAGRTGPAVAFRFNNTGLILYPTPPAGGTYEHIYVPQPADLSSADDSTVIEMATTDGEAFLLWSVIALARDKLEMDTSTAERQREGARARVIEWATLRSLNSGRRRPMVDEADALLYDPSSFYFNPA